MNAGVGERDCSQEVGNVVGHLFDDSVIELLNVFQLTQILAGDEVDGNTFATETARPTDSVK
jgi:hypothetical protein